MVGGGDGWGGWKWWWGKWRQLHLSNNKKKTLILKDICALIFTMTKMWRQLKHPSIEDLIKKM